MAVSWPVFVSPVLSCQCVGLSACVVVSFSVCLFLCFRASLPRRRFVFSVFDLSVSVLASAGCLRLFLLQYCFSVSPLASVGECLCVCLRLFVLVSDCRSACLSVSASICPSLFHYLSLSRSLSLSVVPSVCLRLLVNLYV